MMVEEDEEEDRISKLPDAIIVHILSFLPTKDVVRTCLISNRWKLIWYLVPKLSFSNTESHFQEEFFNFVEKCLEHRERGKHIIPESTVTSFELQMEFYETSLVGCLDKWLTFAVDNKVQEIKLCLAVERCKNYLIHVKYYSLPKTLVLKARYLTILELNKVELDSRYSFSFPSLKSLSLHLVQFADNDVLDKLLLGSPSLENLKLCHLLPPYPHQLHIHSSTLKFLQIKGYMDIPLQIEVINLETLELHGVSFEETNLLVCKGIRNLFLNCVWHTKEIALSSLEYLISNLHQLENLTLCSSKHVKISNPHLKSLKLRVNSISKDETRVIIEAPKLVSFCYEGNINHSVSIESSNLLNGKFIFVDYYKNYDANWFIDMMSFMANLDCSWNIVSLHIDSEKALIFPEKMKKICRSPLVNWEHLRVFTTCKLERESDLRDALLWISPSLKRLSIMEKA